MNFIIFPHQLFENISNLKPFKNIYIIEHPIFFGYRESQLSFNKKKLILHCASIQFYLEYLKKNLKSKIIHIPIQKIKDKLNFDLFASINGPTSFYNPVDHLLSNQIEKFSKKHNIPITQIETPNFITSENDFQQYHNSVKNKKKPFFQTAFYKWQRERLHILMKNNKPLGGHLTYDFENRKPLPKNITIPSVKIPKSNKYLQKAIQLINKEFPNNTGTSEEFWCPITFDEAKDWLDLFIHQRLKNFGTYQDAITPLPNPFLFHSGVSSSINIGILDPMYVINRIIEYGNKNKVGLNNIEGFVRQVLGWREFSRYTYIYIYKEMTTENYFQAKVPISKKYYDGTTGLSILDDTIKKAFKNGYLHHIERLMIVGSLMMMIGIIPDDVYKWFMEFAVDSYDWVMINNVYSMALYSDGGLTTTKAYAASSNYEMVRKSGYPRGYEEIWDALYWNFIGEHLEKMRKMGRFGPIQAKNWERKTEEQKKKFRKIAKDFIYK